MGIQFVCYNLFLFQRLDKIGATEYSVIVNGDLLITGQFQYPLETSTHKSISLPLSKSRQRQMPDIFSALLLSVFRNTQELLPHSGPTFPFGPSKRHDHYKLAPVAVDVGVQVAKTPSNTTSPSAKRPP